MNAPILSFFDERFPHHCIKITIKGKACARKILQIYGTDILKEEALANGQATFSNEKVQYSSMSFRHRIRRKSHSRSLGFFRQVFIGVPLGV